MQGDVFNPCRAGSRESATLPYPGPLPSLGTTAVSHDSLAVFSVNAQIGELTPHGQTPAEKTPRFFCLVPGDRFVVSAGEGSHKLIVFRRNADTGALTSLKTYDCGKDPAWVMSVKFD